MSMQKFCFRNISISLLKKIRRPFELFEMKTPFYFSFSKTPPLFPTIARHGPTFPTTSYRSVGIGVWNSLHFIFFLKLKSFQKLAHGQSRASQLSISEDSAIRIVLHSAELARFSHIHPATHRVCHVSPY